MSFDVTYDIALLPTIKRVVKSIEGLEEGLLKQCNNKDEAKIVTQSVKELKASLLEMEENGKKNNLTFGEVVEALRSGSAVRRKDWEDGTLIFKQVPANILTSLIPNMQSIPDLPKHLLESRHQPLRYRNQLVIVDRESRIDSWVPTAADIFAEDWLVEEVLNEDKGVHYTDMMTNNRDEAGVVSCDKTDLSFGEAVEVLRKKYDARRKEGHGVLTSEDWILIEHKTKTAKRTINVKKSK